MNRGLAVAELAHCLADVREVCVQSTDMFRVEQGAIKSNTTTVCAAFFFFFFFFFFFLICETFYIVALGEKAAVAVVFDTNTRSDRDGAAVRAHLDNLHTMIHLRPQSKQQLQSGQSHVCLTVEKTLPCRRIHGLE